MENAKPRRRFHPVYLCLLLPFIADLWVPFYNRVEPTLIGVPFFYWFQLLMVLVGAALTAIIYFATEKK